MDVRSDDDLLAATRSEPEAFAVFYRRHVGPLLAYFARRTRDAELAADLTAETFAAALARRASPPPGARAGGGVAVRHRSPPALTRRPSKGAVEDRARRRLGMGPITLTDEALERVEALAVADASAAILREGLAALPADQREAVLARVLDEDEYADIATRAETSESVIRKRVSRGLTGLRQRLEGTGA